MALTVYYQNARSIRGKTIEFRQSLLTSDFDIVVIVETWLLDGIYDTEVFDSRYDVFRCDRNTNTTGHVRGGGVMVLTKREFATSIGVNISLLYSAHFEAIHEIIPARKINTKVDLHVVGVYLPGSHSSRDPILDSFKFYLNNILNRFASDQFLLIGDFNFSKLLW